MKIGAPSFTTPLGLVPSIFFGLRFFVQWLQSEKQKTSVVTPVFWKLSLAGNLLFMTHYLIQVQYPFALVQASNAAISWRNLNLMKQGRSLSTGATMAIFSGSLLFITLLFVAQSYWFIGELDWIRTPTKLFDTVRQHHSLSWHILGAIGGFLFASRFWIQWWQAERHQRSELRRTFWWLSIIGSVLCLTYFIRIQDYVSLFNQSCGLIPYIRNLMLIRKKSKLGRVIN